MSLLAAHVNSFGLFLDIIGACLILKFGIPERIDRAGTMYIAASTVDEDEIRKARRYDRWSTIGLWALAIGFTVQAVSNYL